MNGLSRLSEIGPLLTTGKTLWDRRDYLGLRSLLGGIPQEELVRESDLAVWYTYSLVATYNIADALTMAATSLRCAQASGNDRAYRRIRNAEGAAFMARGDLLRAMACFSEALVLANSVGDELLVTAASINIGIVSDIRCSYDEALCAYSRGLVSAQKTQDSASIIACYHNIAMSYRQLGFFAASDANFELALCAIAGQSVEDLAGTESERALLYFVRGDHSLAEASVRRVLSYADETCSQGQVAEILRILAIIVAASRPREARAALQRALPIARETTNRLLEAEVLEELAALDLAEGAEEPARRAAAESIRLYEWIGSPARAAAVRQRLRLEIPPTTKQPQGPEHLS